MYLLLPNNTGWRGNSHVGNEHVDVVRLEVPQGSQGRSSWFSAVHQVRHGQAVQAGLLILLRLPARRVPSRGSSKAHSSVNSSLVPARLVQTSQISFQRLQCQTCVANIYLQRQICGANIYWGSDMCGKYILGIKSGFAALGQRPDSLPISREGKVWRNFFS